MKRTTYSIGVIGLLISIAACTEPEFPKEAPTNAVALRLPEQPYTYQGDDHIATLGRVLFYDTRLSINNSISCGTCHKQELAFSDNVAHSRGFENKVTPRNTPPIQNIGNVAGITLEDFRGFENLFWDGRETLLQSMVLKPITNHVEMGMSDAAAVVQKVNEQPYYKALVDKAFNTSTITQNQLGIALASFVANMQANNTAFDLASKNKPDALSPIQQQGLELFVKKYNCISCHRITNPGIYSQFTEFSNIGLDVFYTDNGRGAITNRSDDNGKFKVPNLRNVALTAPYMHDGRFTTLDEVIDHYSTGINNNTNLDPRLKDKNNQAAVFNITATEKKAMIAFLGSLTDFSLTTDKRLSDPFTKN